MKINRLFMLLGFFVCMLGGAFCLHAGEQLFRDSIGPVEVKPVAGTDPLSVPYITWGGDMVTFYANGGLNTQPGTLFKKQGLNINLVPGDNFAQQVKNYISGKSPFLRGTFRMMGMASEVIGADSRTEGVMIMQMTWSAGDHLVVRPGLKTIKDMKGKSFVLQQGGPHVGMLDDILKSARLSWDDIKVVWAEDLTASPKSPAQLFRKDNTIAGCFVITPDMIGLCGGLRNTGSGAEGTEKGSRVLVSTAELSHSIADVYLCRKDFYVKHKDVVTKFVASYLKGCEEVIKLKRTFGTNDSADYMKLLKLTQDIYGKETIPTLEEDAHGLLSDCTLIGYPGNVSFFKDQNSLHGFEAFQKSALDLAINRGYATKRHPFHPSDLNYQDPAFLSYLTATNIQQKEKFNAEAVQSEIEELSKGAQLDDRTILTFTIGFEPNQNDFSWTKYAEQYQHVIELANRFGNAAIAVRGHADPTKALVELVRAGTQKGIIKRSGSQGDWIYLHRVG